jgi:hypothetical protein
MRVSLGVDIVTYLRWQILLFSLKSLARRDFHQNSTKGWYEYHILFYFTTLPDKFVDFKKLK